MDFIQALENHKNHVATVKDSDGLTVTMAYKNFSISLYDGVAGDVYKACKQINKALLDLGEAYTTDGVQYTLKPL